MCGRNANRILSAAKQLAVTCEEGRWDDVPPATGVVWEACETVPKLPKTNKAAYRRKMLGFCVELKVRMF